MSEVRYGYELKSLKGNNRQNISFVKRNKSVALKKFLCLCLFLSVFHFLFRNGAGCRCAFPKQNDPISKQQRQAEKKKLKRAVKSEKSRPGRPQAKSGYPDKEVRKRMKKKQEESG